jgi:hypothetical protein
MKRAEEIPHHARQFLRLITTTAREFFSSPLPWYWLVLDYYHKVGLLESAAMV